MGTRPASYAKLTQISHLVVISYDVVRCPGHRPPFTVPTTLRVFPACETVMFSW